MILFDIYFQVVILVLIHFKYCLKILKVQKENLLKNYFFSFRNFSEIIVKLALHFMIMKKIETFRKVTTT